MKITIKVQRTEEQEVEVDFPLYVKGGDVFDSGGFFDSWTRIDFNGGLITIASRNDGDDSTVFECEMRRINLSAIGGYLNAVNYDRIKPAEFDDMLAQFKARLLPLPSHPLRAVADSVAGTVERGGQFTTDDDELIQFFTEAQQQERRIPDGLMKKLLGVHFDIPVEGRSYRVVGQEGYLHRGAARTFRIEETK